MAYTEKVSLNGTALSFLLYECMNSVHSQVRTYYSLLKIAKNINIY